MGKYEKLKRKILDGNSDQSINFSELCQLLTRLGFRQRIKGDHHIFFQESVTEILNLQPKKSKAKPYQVKQVRQIILKYQLGEIDVD